MSVNGTISLNTLTDADVKKEIERMDRIVRSAMMRRFHRNSDSAPDGEPVTWADPFEELAQREEAAQRAASMDATESVQRVLDLVELPQPIVDRVRALVFDQFRQYEELFLEMIFAAGPHPLEVMRRLFAYVKMKRASLLANMGFREIGPLLRETHAAAATRCRVLFGDYAPAGWQKGAEAVEAMRTAQKGNRNRLGGKKYDDNPSIGHVVHGAFPTNGKKIKKKNTTVKQRKHHDSSN